MLKVRSRPECPVGGSLVDCSTPALQPPERHGRQGNPDETTAHRDLDFFAPYKYTYLLTYLLTYLQCRGTSRADTATSDDLLCSTANTAVVVQSTKTQFGKFLLYSSILNRVKVEVQFEKRAFVVCGPDGKTVFFRIFAPLTVTRPFDVR